MFVQLVVSTLILGSVVIVPPAEGENEKSAAAMASLRCTITDYEEYVKLLMDNLKVEGQALEDSATRVFLEELRPHIASLPKVETRVVMKKYREKCWCDGSMRSPCPEKCMNSCRWFTDSPTFPWKNENDCEGAKSRLISCYCYEGSSTRCNNGNISNCYDGERPEEELVNTTCSRHPIDEKLIGKHFSIFYTIMVSDPLRMQLQTVANKLSSLKQAVMASDSLFNVAYASCCDKWNETPCYPEASDVLNEKLSEFVEIKKSITMDMNSLQETVVSVSNDTRRRALLLIHANIKKYECCLKGLGYSDKDNECEAPGSSRSTLPSPSSPPSSTSS